MKKHKLSKWGKGQKVARGAVLEWKVMENLSNKDTFAEF